MEQAGTNYRIKKIYQIDAHTLGIDWTDGHSSRYRLAHLRRHCPCAGCRDEWTGKPLIKPESISDDIQATRIEAVGRYALSINFTDGHTTGIYSYELLRALEQNAAGEPNKG